MQPGEVTAMLGTINEISGHLATAVGVAVEVELRMRLIAELHVPVQVKLQELLDEAKKKKKITRDKYWDCDLVFLDKAIDFVLAINLLTTDEQKMLKEFREKRNKLMHVDFVSLMELMGMTPAGQQIQSSGKRNILEKKNIKEAIVSIEKSQLLPLFTTSAKQTKTILDKLIYSLPT